MKNRTVLAGCLAACVCLVWPTLALADEVVETTDGRSLLLRSDGTYEFIEREQPEGAYTPVDLTDLKLDIQQMSNQTVEVYGQLQFLGDIGMLSDPNTMFDTAPINVDIANLPRDQRGWILQNCSLGCGVTIQGTIGQFMFQPALIAENLSR